jgi:hypothetical protein
MSNDFTQNYKRITSVRFLNITANIEIESNDRWICNAICNPAGRGKHEVRLFDNYGETYIAIYNIDEHIFADARQTYNISGSSYSSFNTLNVLSQINSAPPNPSLLCRPMNNTLCQLPNFLIDVLLSFDSPVAFETIRRAADAYSKRNIL